MKPAFPPFRQVARYCGDCVALLVCWTVWLALGALLVVQIVIATSHEFALPGWMLRSLEARFAASGVHAQFGRATFNPTGGVLLENLSLSLPEFEQPIARARAVYLDLDPWLLLGGQVDPHRVHGTGIVLYAPGMLTPSGHDEPLVRDLEFTLVPGDTVFTLENLTARVAGIALHAQGAVQIQRANAAGSIAPLPLLAAVTAHFAGFCEQLLRASQQIAALEQPELEVALVPSPTRGAIAHVSVTARRLTLPQFHDLTATELRATARFPLLGEAPAMSPLDASATAVRFGELATASDVRVQLRGALTPSGFAYHLRQGEITARELLVQGFHATDLAAQLTPRPLPQLDASVVAFLEQVPVAAAGQVDLAGQTATVHFEGGAAPALLTPIGAAIKRDIRRFFDYAEPIQLNVDARFAPGWKFAGVAGQAAFRRVDAYRVPIDTAHGEIEFDGRHFIARHARATIGENFARGSFEQDLQTKDYRFLLEGRLRPLEIGGWFHGDWWSNIFSHFEFPEAPPSASVDVAGRWFAPETTGVFVFAESRHPVINTAALDEVRTLLFIRPNFLDGLETVATQGTHGLHGTFTYQFDSGSAAWSKLTFAADSTLELDLAARLLGPTLAPQLSPFVFKNAPQLHVVGDFDGPGSAAGSHQNLRIEARSTGDFSFHRFPVQNLSVDALLHDDELTLDHLRVDAAGGALTGHARVWGPATDRRLRFEAALKSASLPQAVALASEYAALRQRRTATAAEKIFTGKNQARLDLSLAAEGRLADPYSYEGSGSAAITGELGQVRLLGLLSELLNFTSLRFTAARTEFKVQGRKLVFPAVSVTGANSAISAHGDYLLDRRELDFNARVYPFQESNSLLSVVGLVLTPFSAVLEVKLTGPLDQPHWAFVIGPTNLIRSLGAPAATPTPASPADAPAPAASAATPAAKETH